MQIVTYIIHSNGLTWFFSLHLKFEIFTSFYCVDTVVFFLFLETITNTHTNSHSLFVFIRMKILSIFCCLIISTNACNRIRYASKCYQCDNCDEPFSEYAYNLNKKTCFPNQVCIVSIIYRFLVYSFIFS